MARKNGTNFYYCVDLAKFKGETKQKKLYCLFFYFNFDLVFFFSKGQYKGSKSSWKHDQIHTYWPVLWILRTVNSIFMLVEMSKFIILWPFLEFWTSIDMCKKEKKSFFFRL